MYKVFINNLPLVLCFDAKKASDVPSALVMDCNDAGTAKKIVEEYLSGARKIPCVLINPDVDQLFSWCFSDFKKIRAGGGLVLNAKGQLLFIYRNDKWDLPKGKLDKGEKKDVAALREVEEECGISGHSIRKELPSTWHCYEHKGEWVIKVTYWYIMDYPGTSIPKPQEEEGITKVEWRELNQVDDILENTFPSIIDCLENLRKEI